MSRTTCMRLLAELTPILGANVGQNNGTEKSVKTELERLYQQHGTWAAVGQKLGINKALAWQAYQGKHNSAAVRAALGLPCPIPVVPCPCGKVHTRSTCAKGRQIVARRSSSEPDFLRFIQERVVPVLMKQQDDSGARQEQQRVAS